MIYNYDITLKHDGGSITIRTAATRMTQAIRVVLNYEGAPFSAITKIRRT